MGDPTDQVGTYRSGGETEGLAVIAPLAFAAEDADAAAKAEELGADLEELGVEPEVIEALAEGEGDEEVEVEEQAAQAEQAQAEEEVSEADTESEQAAEQAESEEPAAFDPGEHTVAEVVDFVAANPDQRDSVLAAEKAGKNRSTLVNQLSA